MAFKIYIFTNQKEILHVSKELHMYSSFNCNINNLDHFPRKHTRALVRHFAWVTATVTASCAYHDSVRRQKY